MHKVSGSISIYVWNFSHKKKIQKSVGEFIKLYDRQSELELEQFVYRIECNKNTVSILR